MRALLLLLHELDSAAALARHFKARPELELPHLFRLGLWKIATGDVLAARAQGILAGWGRVRRQSPGDHPAASHWEMAGAIIAKPFADFAELPDDFVRALERECRIKFLLRGTPAELEEEHRQSGRAILSTRPGSVLEIAAHADAMPAPRLLEICRLARRVANRWRVARVVGHHFPGGRHDFAMVPPRTILNAIAERGLHVHGIGPVSELFAGSGITRSTAIETRAEGFAATEMAWNGENDGLVFASLGGVAVADPELSWLDAWLGGFLPTVEPEDLVILAGAARTGEEAPLILLHAGRRGPLGTRSTFADVAASLAEFFRLRAWPSGVSFLRGRG
jgi:phosphopentomutase